MKLHSHLTLKCLATLSVLLCLPAFAYSAPLLQLAIDDVATGSNPFDSGTCSPNISAANHVSGSSYIAGEDACSTDTVVRTHDTITYLWNYTVNAENANNLTISQTLPAGLAFETIPPECVGTALNGANPISALSSDKRSLVCNLGSVTAGTAKAMFVQVRVLGSTANGTVLTTAASITADQASIVHSGNVSDIVSAAPKFELATAIGASTPRLTYGPSNEIGFVVMYDVGIYKNGTRVGSEALANTITASLTSLYGTAASKARLFTWGPAGAAGACNINNAAISTVGFPDGGNMTRLPYGTLADPNAKTRPGYAVSNSGTFTCTQASAGAPVALKITGADTTLAHVPDFNPHTRKPITDRSYAITGWVKVFVPLSDVIALGGTNKRLDLNGTYVSFDPTSISSQSNFGAAKEDPANNSARAALVDLGVRLSGSLYFGNDSLDNIKGNLLILPGAITTQAIGLGSQGTQEVINPTACMTIDNSKGEIVDATTTGAGSVGAIIEYSAVGSSGQGSKWASFEDMRAVDCDNSGGPWYASIAAVPGGAAAVTKVRMKVAKLDSVTASNSTLNVRVKATTTTAGDIITSFGAFRADNFTSGLWLRNPANKVDMNDPALQPPAYASRGYLNLGTVKVSIQHVPNNPNDPIRRIVAGNDLQMKIFPTFTSVLNNLAPTLVRVTNTLPAELSYNTLSASKVPSQIIKNNDGTTKLVWNYNIAPKTPIDPITFSAHVSELVANFTPALNCVEIASNYDQTTNDLGAPCGDYYRPLSAKAEVLISNPSAFAIAHSTNASEIIHNGNLAFTVTYKNTAQFDLPNGDIIDVLPFNGDSSDPGLDGMIGTLDDFHRTPGSSFSGSIALASVQTTNNELIAYTKKAAPLVSQDPSDPSNQANGSTMWCMTLSGGNCPANLSEVTAVRIIIGAIPMNSPAKSVTLNFATSGNHESDRYANNFGAVADGLLPVFANSLSASVIGGHISGSIFVDTDEDRLRGQDEAGISNVEVMVRADANNNGVLDTADNAVAVLTTDAEGSFSAANLVLDLGNGSATYFVEVTDKNGALANYTRSLNPAPGDSSNSVSKITLSPANRADTAANFGYRPVQAICQPVSQSGAQLTADQLANALKIEIQKILSVRKKLASGGQCAAIKPKTQSKIVTDAQETYVHLWTAIWTQFPAELSQCGTGFVPATCSQIDVTANSIQAFADVQSLSKLLNNATKGCSTPTKMKAAKKRATATLKSLQASVAALKTKGLVCK